MNHLEGMRNFIPSWQEMISKHSNELQSEDYLSDAMFFNAIASYHPNVITTLDCARNIQLESIEYKRCFTNKSNESVLVLNFNSWSKFGSVVEHCKSSVDHHIENLVTTTLDANGYSFREFKPKCRLPNFSRELTVFHENPFRNNSCSDFTYEANFKHRVLPFFKVDHAETEGSKTLPNSVSLVTQISFDRIFRIEEICQHWRGPLSVAVHLSDADLVHLVHLMIKEFTCLSSSVDSHLHLVFRKTSMYPVNMLRNVAMKYVQTPYVFILDADFYPFGNFEPLLIDTRPDPSPLAVVIPAFELQSNSTENLSVNISNKTALLELVKNGTTQPFHLARWFPGHGPTNFSKWYNSSEPYTIEWAPRFEPYIIVKLKYLPRFDERFIGYGYNKVSFFMELDAMNYKMVVHPSAFVVHMPHSRSTDDVSFKENQKYFDCILDLKTIFVSELASKYSIDPEKYLV